MVEVYPSDNELLNITNDTETGVEYIPTGTAPYYLHFRKLLYRLLLATTRGNDLRVVDEGDLNIGVKKGKYWADTTLINYAGSSGNTLTDNRDNIYIYLDSSGTLVINEYSSFPDMKTIAHIRLAIVTTSGGKISSIIDARDHHKIYMPFGAGGIKKTIEAHTSSDTLTIFESGSVHTNYGSTGTVTITLPTSATAGMIFTFAVQESQELRIDPGLAAIRDSCGQTADKYKYANTIGASTKLIADQNSNWVTIAKYGTWTEET